MVDSRHPVLVWEPGIPVPLYAFPHDEVRHDLLRPAKNPPTGTHTGSRIFYDLVIGGEPTENAAWTYPRRRPRRAHRVRVVPAGRPGARPLVRGGGRDLHPPRDPHKRVDAIPSSRHVRVEIHGTVVADTHRPVLVFETGLPTRYYIPREDVRLDLFEPTDHSTGCPYKGTAAYWSWRGQAGAPAVPPNIVWSYPRPLPAVGAVKDLLAFYNEAVDIVVDGDPWSGRSRPSRTRSRSSRRRDGTGEVRPCSVQLR